MLDGCGPVLAGGITLGKSKERRCLPCCVPGGLIESIVGFLSLALVSQCKPQVVVRLTVARIWIEGSQAGDGLFEMLSSLLELAATQKPQSQCVAEARIDGVT